MPILQCQQEPVFERQVRVADFLPFPLLASLQCLRHCQKDMPLDTKESLEVGRLQFFSIRVGHRDCPPTYCFQRFTLVLQEVYRPMESSKAQPFKSLPIGQRTSSTTLGKKLAKGQKLNNLCRTTISERPQLVDSRHDMLSVSRKTPLDW